MNDERKEFGKWWMWVLALLVVSSVVFGGLRVGGLIGGTVVEREVFKRSFQYKEARNSEIAVYEATLAEISTKLSNPELDVNTRTNLEAQASALRIQLSAARRK